MSTLLAFLKDNWHLLAPLLVAIATLINSRTSSAGAHTFLRALIDLLSVMPQSGAPARLVGASKPLTAGWKLPLAMVTHRAPAAPTLNLVPVLLLVVLGVAGCAFCKQAQNAAKPECKIETIVVKCGTAELQAAAAAVLPDVLAALQGEKVNWSALLKLEEQYGISAVACAIQAADQAPQAQAKLSTPPGCKHVHKHAAEALGRMRVHVQ